MPRPSAKAAPMKGPAELAVGGRRVAQCAREEITEDRADADGGGAHADGGQAGTDILGGIHIGVG